MRKIKLFIMGLFGYKYYMSCDTGLNGKTTYITMRHHKRTGKYRVINEWYKELP